MLTFDRRGSVYAHWNNNLPPCKLLHMSRSQTSRQRQEDFQFSCVKQQIKHLMNQTRWCVIQNLLSGKPLIRSSSLQNSSEKLPLDHLQPAEFDPEGQTIDSLHHSNTSFAPRCINMHLDRWCEDALD